MIPLRRLIYCITITIILAVSSISEAQYEERVSASNRLVLVDMMNPPETDINEGQVDDSYAYEYTDGYLFPRGGVADGYGQGWARAELTHETSDLGVISIASTLDSDIDVPCCGIEVNSEAASYTSWIARTSAPHGVMEISLDLNIQLDGWFQVRDESAGDQDFASAGFSYSLYSLQASKGYQPLWTGGAGAHIDNLSSDNDVSASGQIQVSDLYEFIRRDDWMEYYLNNYDVLFPGALTVNANEPFSVYSLLETQVFVGGQGGLHAISDFFNSGAFTLSTNDPDITLERLTVVPEPISSTLFIVGGATLGLRRLRKKFKK